MKVGFIGAGNMGGAILKGYAPVAEKAGHQILVFDPKEENRTRLQNEFEVVTACGDMESLVEESDLIVLGVKPNLFDSVLPSIAKHFTKEKTLVSMAAGVTISFMEGYLGEGASIVRIMPNTPALVREAMVALCRNRNVDDGQFAFVFEIFNSLGKAEEIEEDLFHCVIGVSGSSPAYTYMYIDALIQSAVENGMDQAQAKIFAAQSVLGAAKMVMESDDSPEQLRINVCSPGGTTIEAVETLFGNGFTENVKEAFQAAVEKSKKISG